MTPGQLQAMEAMDPVPSPDRSVGRLKAILQRARDDSLTRNSIAMMSTTISNSALGYVFWIVAANSYSAARVGAASALISAATVAATLGDVGLRTAIMQDLPQRREAGAWSARVSSALLLGAVVSSVAGVAAWIALARLSHQTGDLLKSAWPVVLVLFTMSLTLSNIFDGISAAERRANQVFRRNALVSIVKVAAIGVFALCGLSAGSVLLSALFATAAGVLYGLTRQLRKLQPAWRFTARGFTQSVAQARRSMLGHHLINIGGWLPAFILPLEVVARQSTQANAYFSFAWMVGGVFFMVSPSVASALFVQGRWDEEGLHRATVKASKFIVAILAPLALFLAVFGHWILDLFGSEYSRHGYPVLLILALSAVPDAITNVRIAQLRARRQLSEGAKINLGMAVIAIGMAWIVLPRFGITGAAMSWLVAQTAGSLWILLRARLGSRGATGVAA